MSYSIEKTAKTVDEAVESVLKELNLTKDEIDIEILEQGNKGIFGILGGKSAKVRITVKGSNTNEAKYFLSQIFNKMGVEASIEVEENNDTILLAIQGEDTGIIIGRRGETLDSLQYLVNLAVTRGKANSKKVIIDAENYRQKREETLVRLANRLANRVFDYKKNITLEPMSSHDRRVIHATLQDHKYVKTFSIGEEPYRKVVISLK